METTAPKQASHDAQKELQSLINNEESIIELSSGRKVKIGWIMPDTQDKIDDIIVEHDEIAKKIESGELSINKGRKYTREFYPKMIAAILLNSHWGLKLFWKLKWHIIHHYWKLNGNDYARIIAEAKKKAEEQQYLMAMAYSMTMSDVWTIMTKKEAEVFLQELKSEKEQQQ